MATATHIKALLESHAHGDDVQFYAVAMQVAAHAARQGHGTLAQDIRALVDKSKQQKTDPSQTIQTQNTARKPDPRTRLISLPKDLTDLLSISQPDLRLSDMVLTEDVRFRLQRILHENRQRDKLARHGLRPRRKLLLMGPPGTGKTLTASVLAAELHLPLMRVVFEGLMSRYLGETAAKLRIIFDSMEKIPGVYLFDEFDAIGSQRALQGDVGEIRRVLASFLQLLEQDSSTSLIVAATNNPQLLDPALFRRFDDAVEYSVPADVQIRDLIENRLSPYPTDLQDWTCLMDKSRGLSYAELALVCDDAAKEMVLSDAVYITDQHMLKALAERHTGRRGAPLSFSGT